MMHHALIYSHLVNTTVDSDIAPTSSYLWLTLAHTYGSLQLTTSNENVSECRDSRMAKVGKQGRHDSMKQFTPIQTSFSVIWKMVCRGLYTTYMYLVSLSLAAVSSCMDN